MKKLPKSLKIGGHTYKIISDCTNDKLAGEVDRRAHTIFIDGDLEDSAKVATLIHEVLHVCNSTMSATEYGHALVDSLAEQISAVLINNKLLK